MPASECRMLVLSRSSYVSFIIIILLLLLKHPVLFYLTFSFFAIYLHVKWLCFLRYVQSYVFLCFQCI